MQEVEAGFLAGKDQYKFMRALFGLVVCLGIGVVTTLFTKARPFEELRGLVWGTVQDAITRYKGSEGTEAESDWVAVTAVSSDDNRRTDLGYLPFVRVAPAVAEAIDATAGDLVFVSDARAWLGGLRASHARIEVVDEDLQDAQVTLGPDLQTVLGVALDSGKVRPLRIKRMY